MLWFCQRRCDQGGQLPKKSIFWIYLDSRLKKRQKLDNSMAGGAKCIVPQLGEEVPRYISSLPTPVDPSHNDTWS
jgi:hypothetical protein